MQNNIQLLKPRNLGLVIRDSFSFLKINFKPFAQVVLIVVLPFIILGGFLYSSFIFGIFGSIGKPAEQAAQVSGMFAKVIPAILSILVGTTVLFVAILETFFVYEKSETGIITAADIFRGIKADILRFFAFVILGIIIGVLSVIILSILSGIFVGIVGMGGSAFGFLAAMVVLVGFIYLTLGFIFSPIIFLRERCDLITAFGRSFLLIKGHWWQTFGILLVMYIIVYGLIIVAALPFYAYTFFTSFSGIKTGQAFPQMGNWGAVYLAFLFCFVTIIGTLFHNAVILQYYSLTEQKYGENIMQQINNLDVTDSEPA